MRFLMLNWRDPVNPMAGGAERVSKAYLAELVRRGHEVYWFAYDFPGGQKEEMMDGIHIVRGGGRGSSVLQARTWYRQQKPFDLVIDQHHGIPWYAPLWCKTHCIAYIHEVLGPIWGSFYPWPLRSIGFWQERWTHWFYRKIPFWTPSESTKKSLIRNGVQEVNVFPNGVDTVPLPQLEAKTISAPLKLAVVCRLAPNKRVDHAILVVKHLLDRGVHVQLTIMGGGEMASALKQLASELNLDSQILFTGSVSESKKNNLLRQSHFLVHTSVREGWGLNVIEANAMGTPAAVYPVGGLVDSVVAGKTGVVTAQETPESMARALFEIIKEPAKYESLRHGAWERSKQFQWSQVLGPVCDWLESHAVVPWLPERRSMKL